MKGGGVNKDTTLDSSNSVDPIDSDYVNTKETIRTKEKQKTTATQRPRVANKVKDEAEKGKDPSPRAPQRSAILITPIKENKNRRADTKEPMMIASLRQRSRAKTTKNN